MTLVIMNDNKLIVEMKLTLQIKSVHNSLTNKRTRLIPFQDIQEEG